MEAPVRSAVTVVLFLALAALASAQTLSLAGRWRYRLDRLDAGERERWFTTTLPGELSLPGDLAQQGIGDRPGPQTRWTGGIQDPGWPSNPAFASPAGDPTFRFPFWLTPEHHYLGAAWYQRDLDVPAGWSGRRLVLHLERPHGDTHVWLDERNAGRADSLGTPHEFELGPAQPGRHTLTIRVDNRFAVDVGINSHSVSDHTQGNWNGLVGRLELRASPLVWLDDLQAFPDRTHGTVRVRGRVGNHTGQGQTVALALQLHEAGATSRLAAGSLALECAPGGSSFETELICTGPPAAWDEFTPRLYQLEAEVRAGPDRDARQLTVGFRDLATTGTQFLINGRRVFFRGTLECAIFPRTGHPPTDVASWRRILRIARAHGLNLLRFHSWCPPEAAFEAADELGVYLHVECSTWPNHSTSLGDGKPIDAWSRAEAARILRHFGNHPSFVLLLHGNEPGGRRAGEFLQEWVSRLRQEDPRRLYSGGAGWPQIAANQFHVAPEPRIQAWGAGLKSRLNARPPETTTDYRAYIAARRVPVISHEIGQWCVYPNFAEIEKYTGYLKARNFELFRAELARHHLADQAEAFLHASGRLQTLCYKEDIESALRTPGMGGFELLDLHDFPGQGTALVGVLDAFWEEKGYVRPEEYRRFAGPTVPLARLPRRVFTRLETFTADLEIAHFGPAPLRDARPVWRLVDEAGRVLRRGELPTRDIPVDNGIPLGRIELSLEDLSAPAHLRLMVGLHEMPVENDWDLWVYPDSVDNAPPAGVRFTTRLEAADLAALRAGTPVVLALPPARVRRDPARPVELGFSSIFWNTAWTHRQAPTTLGLRCDPQHAALAGFPTAGHSDWQWWYVIHHAAALLLDDLPADLRPTVAVIDDWFTARRLGLLLEARVEGGRILVCSVDLAEPDDPVRRQLRASLLRYAGSPAFQPGVTITLEQLRGLMTP